MILLPCLVASWAAGVAGTVRVSRPACLVGWFAPPLARARGVSSPLAGLLRRFGRAGSGLEQGMHVAAHVAEFVHGIVQGPALGVQAGNFVPELAVCVQELVQVDGAEARFGGQVLGGVFEDLLIKGLERC